MEELALLGGKPVRSKPFASGVIVDAEERRQIAAVLKSKEFSRFMGSPTDDIERVLRLSSAEALDYNPQYFTFLGGRKVREFERDFAKAFGARYAVSVNSATSGLTAAVLALGIEPGDEVLTTCMSFNATAAAVVAAGGVPVFCDVSAENFCLDPKQVERHITPQTKAVLVVHLLGNPADMDALLAIAKKRKLKVIEDCAQSPGVKYKGRWVGTIGDLGVFSLQETKNITTGEGGMITTDDPEFAARCRLIRNHGESVPDASWSDERLVNIVGYNFRMTELTAALGVAQLKKLPKNNAARHKNAQHLASKLRGLPGLSVQRWSPGAVCHVMALLYDEAVTGVARLNVVHALRAEGIPIGTGYAKLMHHTPLYQRRIAFGRRGFPFTLRGANGQSVHYTDLPTPVADELLSKRFLWFYHVNRPNTSKDMDDVARAFKKVFCNLDALKDWQPGGRKLAYKW